MSTQLAWLHMCCTTIAGMFAESPENYKWTRRGGAWKTLRELVSSERAASMSSSESYTLAGPSNTRPSLPVIFATQPSGAKLPYRICKSK